MSTGELYVHLFEDTRQMMSETISTYVIGLFEKLAFSIKLCGCRFKSAEHIDYKIFLKLFSACTTVIFSNILQLISLYFFQVTILILDEFYCFIFFLLFLTFSYKYLMCFFNDFFWLVNVLKVFAFILYIIREHDLMLYRSLFFFTLNPHA